MQQLLSSRMNSFVTALLMLLTVFYASCNKKSGSGSEYRVAALDEGPVKTVVMATGKVSAVTTVQIGSQVSGTIREILVDFNSPVRKGEVVARLDPTFLEAAVREAEANVTRSRASLLQAERNLKRAQDLFDKNLVAQVELDNAQTEFDVATASFAQTEAAVERAKVNLTYSVIRSPIDGVVISRDVSVGQTVAASLQAPTLFTVAQDLRLMQIETSIDEADIGGLKEGMSTSFTVDSYPEEKFRGTIRQIRFAAKAEQNVVTYPVIIDVENPDLKLRPGMTANVTIVTASRDHVLRMPATALRFKPAEQLPESASRAGNSGGARAESGRSQKRSSATVNDSTRARSQTLSLSRKVYVKDSNGKPAERAVQLGLNDGSFVEILGGDLQAGDSVIVGLAGTSAAAAKTAPGFSGPGRR